MSVTTRPACQAHPDLGLARVRVGMLHHETPLG